MNRRFTWNALAGFILASSVLNGCDKSGTTPAPPANAGTPKAPAAGTGASATAPKHESAPAPVSMAPSTSPATTKPSDVVPTKAPAPPPATRSAIAATKPTIDVPDDPRVATFQGLAGPKPTTWLWRPVTKQFNVAEYSVPGQDGADQASISVITAGGSLEANIARWKGQFRGSDGKPVEPKVEKFTADGMNITTVEFAGEYKGMQATNYTPNTLFITGIVEAPSGQLFVRFVGPAVTVEANRTAFLDLLHGLKKIEAQK